MTRLALIPLLAVVALAVTACGDDDKDKEGLSKPCPPAPAAMATAPTLPGNFPDAEGITYTGVKTDGPATVATGYLPDEIGPAHDAYVKAVTDAPGYSVTKEEQDEADAEVNFTGAGNSGQVKLLQTCTDRTSVVITIRPA
jgi:hypothetical protein